MLAEYRAIQCETEKQREIERGRSDVESAEHLRIERRVVGEVLVERNEKTGQKRKAGGHESVGAALTRDVLQRVKQRRDGTQQQAERGVAWNAGD